MHEMRNSERALSETMSLIFMAMLVIIAAILLIASMTGVISNLLQKPALFSTQVIQIDTSDDSAHIIGVFHQQGDAVDLNGTTQTGGSSIVSLILINTGGSSFTVSPDGALQKNQWGPGDMLYIYSKNSGVSYVYSDTAPPGASSLPTGTYTIKILDDKVNVIINALPVTIRY